MSLILWTALAQAAPSELCAPDRVAALEASLEAVNAAYEALDEPAFDRASKQVDAAVACLDQVPPGSTVARLHQGMALVAFVNGQKVAARRAMIAARLADPTWKLAPDLFPSGHPFIGIYEGATDAGPVAPIGEIGPRRWVIDGIPREEAPTERAFLLQVESQGRIDLAEYLYDAEEIPDLGQDSSEPVWATPRTVSIGAFGALRSLSADQQATGDGVDDQAAAKLGAGGGLTVRLTPIAFLGAELAGASHGGSDPLLGGTFGLEAHAAGLFGAGTRVGETLQVFGNARLGYARDTVIGWTTTPAGPSQGLWQLNCALVGGEVGLRGEGMDARLVVDALLGGGGGLYETRGGVSGAIGVVGPLALDLGLSARRGHLPLRDPSDEVIADRHDTELRAQIGPTLWFD